MAFNDSHQFKIVKHWNLFTEKTYSDANYIVGLERSWNLQFNVTGTA
jgi:hypothetical protein